MSTDTLSSLQTLPGRWQSLETGHTLFCRSNKVCAMYYLTDGEIHLSRTSSDGNVIIMQRCTAGMIVAEASLFASTYHCDAHAVATARVYRIAKRTFKRHLSETDGLLLDWSKSLSNEIQTLRLRNEILRMRTVRERLDAWLLWQHTALPPKGTWLAIAQEIGVSAEALYREIARRA